MNEFRIDAPQQRSLVFSERSEIDQDGWCQFVIEMTDPNCTAISRVYYNPSISGRLDDHFTDISESWKGWKGTKTWENNEHPGFSLREVSDPLGHAQLNAKLWTENAWSAEIVFDLNTVDFDRFSKSAKKFFSE